MNISRKLDQFAAWLPLRPAVYFLMVIVWAVTLWFLSSGNPGSENAPKIPHLDKVAHFSYFLCGGAALAACLGLKWSDWTRFRVFAIVTIIFVILGRLDEYHQSFTPGRSANDTGDWIADIIGAVVGALLVIIILIPRLLQRVEKSSPKTRNVANSLDC
ncbi:MAG: VanZ family protein [Akkermansiaceae bacterium]